VGGTSELLSDSVKEMEYTLARHKAVLAKFPDAKVHYYNGYAAKSVNKIYTAYKFETLYGGLYVMPYYELEFTYNGADDIIKISSQPFRNRLVHLDWRTINGKKVMKFARFAINQKNHQFKEDMLNACKVEIMKFIQNNPDCHMDDKHLEPRLKKLLLFT
jgi:hypothetical protein